MWALDQPPVRYIVRAGLIGEVRWVDSYYIQGWLSTKLEDTGQQQASWRVDPKRAGAQAAAAISARTRSISCVT